MLISRPLFYYIFIPNHRTIGPHYYIEGLFVLIKCDIINIYKTKAIGQSEILH